MKLTVPDSGKVWKRDGFLRWTSNFIAIPWRGLHIGWLYEAHKLVDRIEKTNPSSVTLEGHSRGAAVAVYVAVLLRTYNRHLPIKLNLTGSPRVWFRQSWCEHYEKRLKSVTIHWHNAHGDIVGLVPPWPWRHYSEVKFVGPRRLPGIKPHHPDYIEKHI